MAVELDSFFIKFKNLWASGHEAKLAVNSRNGKLWMNLQVGLQSPQPHPGGPAHHQGQGNARQRRNIRRAAARAANVTEEVTKTEKAEVATAEEATVEETVKAVNDSGSVGVAVEATEKIKATVEMDKKKCTIELAPVDLRTIDSFRDNIEKYFSDKKDIIDDVIACTVNNAGRSVRLEAAVKRQLWMNYFNQPEDKYGDLIGVKRVLHCCKDLVNCDRRLA